MEVSSPQTIPEEVNQIGPENSSINVNTTDILRDENLAIVEVATLGTLFVLIVFMNCCVLLALALRRLKMTRMYYYLLHLCISDLITGFFTVLPQLAWDITYRFNGGNFLCKIVKCMQILGPYLSSYVLVVTAIDRYQAICFPLSNCSWTPRRAKLMITCAWIISIVCSLPQAFIFSYQKVSKTSDVYDCWGTFPQPWGERIYVTWYAISIFFIPLVILTFTHVHICREIWVNLNLKRQTGKQETQTNTNVINNNNDNYYSRTRKCLLIAINRVYRLGRRQNTETVEMQTNTDNLEIRPLHSVVTYQESSSSSPRVNTVNRLSRAKIKTVKITVVVILCYVICSSPFICVQLWAYWWPDAKTTPFWTGPIITILMLLSSLNSFVNPIIYLFFNKNLVKSLMHFCCRVNINEDFTKTNASELNSNYNNYEQRNPSQTSLDDDNKRNNTLSLNHRSDYHNMPSKRQSHQSQQNYRTRRSSIKRTNFSINDRNASDI